MSKKQTKSATKKIIVTGDITIDWLEVSTPPVEFDSSESTNVNNWQSYPGTRFIIQPGGALLLARFVRAATDAQVLAPTLPNIEYVPTEEIIHSFAYLDKFPYSTAKKGDKKSVYRIKQHKGFAGPKTGTPRFLPVKDDDADAKVVVLDDAGNGFRSATDVWPAALKKGHNPLVLVTMSRSIERGPLWDEMLKHHAERMVAVVDADDLRGAGVKISRQLSWERTATDLVWQIASNPDLVFLNSYAYVVVRFGVEGTILHTRRGGIVEARLFFDPKMGEGSFGDMFPGKMLGVNCAFIAALSAYLTNHGFEGLREGVRQGLLSARLLWQLGFGDEASNIDYPEVEIFNSPQEHASAVVEVRIPTPTNHATADPNYWCILKDLARGGLEVMASNYVRDGSDPMIDQVPTGQFNNLKTVDRSEIESYRSIQNLIREYLAALHISRPLSIAVFGPPGSGKSFGVSEVAESVAPGQIKKLEFNLSQFNSSDDLIVAFHQIRDLTLAGKIPLVFFDEFDTEFHGRLGWLKYFLAPMQDGKFRDGATFHPTGRAIFVFAGGTAKTFAEFSMQSDDYRSQEEPDQMEANDRALGEAKQAFKHAKGLDFISRLRGYVNIKGANPISEDDMFYVIRRALFLRFILQKGAAHLVDSKHRLAIDLGVLRALIKVPEYTHGVRSMSAIVEMSMLADRKSFEQAALPPPEQLELHVDAEMFSRLVVRDVLLGSAREALAKLIHEQYRQNQENKKTKDKKTGKKDPAMAPWGKLPEHFKETNRQQADHIPEMLKAINCDFAPVLNKTPRLFRFTDEEIEIMAEMEHHRWNRQKFLAGWSYGETKDAVKKTHPCLVEWKDLLDKEKDKDRSTVGAIPQLLKSAKFEIYRLKDKR